MRDEIGNKFLGTAEQIIEPTFPGEAEKAEISISGWRRAKPEKSSCEYFDQ